MGLSGLNLLSLSFSRFDPYPEHPVEVALFWSKAVATRSTSALFAAIPAASLYGCKMDSR